MQTTAALFFLILGQADGFATGDNDYGSNLTTIPTPYHSLASCEDAGEAAREYNQGLSFLSYTCVPGPTVRQRPVGNHFTPHSGSLSAATAAKAAQTLGPKDCDAVCELIEATP